MIMHDALVFLFDVQCLFYFKSLVFNVALSASEKAERMRVHACLCVCQLVGAWRLAEIMFGICY